jgi:hypothetical protein
MKMTRYIAPALLACLLCAIYPRARAVAADKLIWKVSDTAQIKLEDRVPKTWGIWTIEKRKNLVLILLGHRYLILDLKTHTVYEIQPNALTKHGDDVETDEPAAIGREIPSSDWVERDVGPAERVLIKLGDYGRTLELVLPHPIDLRRGIY